MVTESREPVLLTVAEAIELAGGRPSRPTAYAQVKREGHLLGVQALRAGKRIFIPREAFMRALQGEHVEEHPDAA